MSAYWVGLGLALLASIALNVSYLVQHSASAHEMPAIDIRRPLRTLRGFLASPLWLAGGALGLLGWGLHIAALTRAPLSLVQAFLVGGIIFLVPVAVRVLGHQLSRGEIAGVALVVIALVGLTLERRHVGANSTFTTGPLAAYLSAAVALALAFVAAGRGARRAQALGIAGGVLYGAADVAIKALTGIGQRQGFTDILTSGWLPAAAITSIAAFFAFQRGLQSGRAMAVIALMTAGTNLVSILGGLVVFGDPLGHSAWQVGLHIASFVAIAFAAWLLAPAQAAVTLGGEAHAGEEPERAASSPAARMGGWDSSAGAPRAR